jgi:16S rRNA (cytosine967-C5)-methyltransferase
MSKQRIIAAQITYEVVFKKQNLSEVFNQRLSDNLAPEFKSAVKALCYDTIRHYLQLQDRWQQCIKKLPKDKLVRVILSQALAEFYYQNKPEHVVVNEAANVAKKLKKRWACGLINATLRQVLKNKEYKPSDEVAHYEHPQWWINLLKHDWPDDWQTIMQANNQKPPLWVRCKKPIECAQKHPSIEGAYKIEAQIITNNDDFVSGNLSVQDASAQLAAHILNPKEDERILDMCAAPGGKTGHLLELNKTIKLDALELYENRAKKIHENLQRLDLNATVIVGDGSQTDEWFKGEKYDKILLDAPCSASGIVRRQVDVKFQRKPEDFKGICQTQQELLSSAANLLTDGGRLLYATCSVFNQENSQQIKLFLNSHPEFSEIKLKYDFATNCEYGIQVLTGSQDMDGFYYCYLTKHER